MSIGNTVYKDGSRDECLLERVENIITGEIELPENILLDKIYQWNNNVQVVKDELLVKFSKT